MSYPDDRLAPRPDDDYPRDPGDRRPRRPDDDRRRYYDDDRGLPRRERKSNALMIVLIIVGLLIVLGGGAALLIIPARNKVVNAAAQRVQSQSNLKQMGIALENITSVQGMEPPVVGQFPLNGPDSTLFFHLLPYIEQDTTYNRATRNAPFGQGAAPTGISPGNGFVKMYCAPADPSNPGKNTLLTSYCANGAFFNGQHGGSTPLAAAANVKGAGNCILIFERFAAPDDTPREWPDPTPRIAWLYSPYDNFDDFPFSGPRPVNANETGFFDANGNNGEVDFDRKPSTVSDAEKPHAFGSSINVLFADGSVRALDRSVNATRVVLPDGSSARVWAWGCSLYGMLSMAPMPPGW
jgi:prepilin-type processing-associated H-X9-DG protein